jgi:hypothetical protein
MEKIFAFKKSLVRRVAREGALVRRNFRSRRGHAHSPRQRGGRFSFQAATASA